MVPTLDTPRLTLRGHTLADFDDSFALWSDPRVVRFIGGRPATGEEAWARLLRYVGHWTLLGFGYWVAVEKASGRFVGEVGYANFRRELEPSLGERPEMGWVIAPWAHGQGFATEAVHAAQAWGDATFTAPTVCIIAPENAPSLRVAEKSGFRELGRPLYKGEAVVLFERP